MVVYIILDFIIYKVMPLAPSNLVITVPPGTQAELIY